MKIAVLGAGALAIALLKVIEDKGHNITMWTKFEHEKVSIEASRENEKLFPGVKIAEGVKITTDINDAVLDAQVIINALPFIAINDTIEMLEPIYKKEQIILSTTKGLDETRFITTTELFENGLKTQKIAALSGPSFAIEIANGHNISFMLGTKDSETKNIITKLLIKENIKIESTDDIVGIQLAGGIKTAITVGAGMLEGINAADSTRAAYLASGMADMAKLIVSLGGKKETTYSYAGIGDLILTCMSHTSRNFTFGYYIGQGYTVEQAFDKMNNKTVEGYKVIRAIYKYIEEKDMTLYTIPTLYNIIFNGGDKEQIKKI